MSSAFEQYQAHEQERKARTNAAFANWQQAPEVKLMISLIPPATEPEALASLLRSAFEAGCGHMAGEMMRAMFEGLLKKARNDEI